MASMGGNLRQRTRCAYFRDGVSPCNKREPGDGLRGARRVQPRSRRSSAPASTASPRIRRTSRSRSWRSTPSSTPVGPRGERAHRRSTTSSCCPATRRSAEHPIGARRADRRASTCPERRIARRSVYLKFRDRQSYEFALVSVAAAVAVDDGVVADVRLALGGVGTKPWRARRAEAALARRPGETRRRSGGAAAVELAGRRRPRAQRVQGRARPAGDRARPRPQPERGDSS